MKELIEIRVPVKVLGYVPKVPELVLESRHLGLVMPEEIESLKEKLNRMAEVLEESLDLDAFMAMAYGAPDFSFEKPQLPKLTGEEPVRIGIAKDEAFCFTYRDNLQLLEEMGAELVSFSPLHDSSLPEGIRGMILSGGYPELYAKELSRNKKMREEIREAVEKGLPCIAECGGFLYLHRTLEGEDGKNYPMAGVFQARGFRKNKLTRFGYIKLTAKEDQLLFQEGDEIQGHEFHYWDSRDCGVSMKAEKPLRKKGWECVHGTKTLYAGFPHLFFYSNPQAAYRFLKQCEVTPCWR